MTKLEICKVKTDLKTEVIEIFIKEVGRYKRRILSFNPNQKQLQILLQKFAIKQIKHLEGKIFEVPEKFNQTNLAFKYLIGEFKEIL